MSLPAKVIISFLAFVVNTLDVQATPYRYTSNSIMIGSNLMDVDGQKLEYNYQIQSKLYYYTDGLLRVGDVLGLNDSETNATALPKVNQAKNFTLNAFESNHFCTKKIGKSHQRQNTKIVFNSDLFLMNRIFLI
ncbi:MAG: hypothetical protein M0P66_13975 [Salinivirgaceae bacterium]|nr:hypothetical protein [Salinivirgaceae bacterium]